MPLAGPPADPNQEVRRCARCHQPTLVRINAWQHTVAGIDTKTVTSDYRCQSCGRKLTLRPRLEILVDRILGGVLLLAIFPGIYLLWRAHRRSRDWTDNPILPGAPVPRMRFHDGPPNRRCGRCGGTATLKSAKRTRRSGVVIGTAYVFQCQGCRAELETEDLRGQLFNFFAGSVMAIIAVAIWMNAGSPGTRYGFGGLFTLLALFAFGTMLARIRAAVQNPALPDLLAP